ncbi:MAG: hypothetical protein MUF07_13345 [Steroidobacteraceae bacterium]|jgi:hypothetical protein|nr:hypothetical protein [Steroidobacteraceae bacterium]
MIHSHPKLGRVVATGLLSMLLVAAAGAAEARERGGGARGGAMTGAPQPRRAAGGGWPRTTETQRTENGRLRSDRWEGADGRSASRDVAVTRDREAGTRTRESAWTRPNGDAGNATTVTRRTDDGFTRNTTVTNAEGQVATRDVAVSRDREAGTATRSVDYSGFDGRSASVDATRTRTADGMTIDRTVVTPGGRTLEQDVVKSCDRAAGKCTTTVTRENTPPPAAP